MELAILKYDQVAGQLGDNEAIHTIIYYTKCIDYNHIIISRHVSYYINSD